MWVRKHDSGVNAAMVYDTKRLEIVLQGMSNQNSFRIHDCIESLADFRKRSRRLGIYFLSYAGESCVEVAR